MKTNFPRLLLSIILALALILSAAPAAAVDFYALNTLQEYLSATPPDISMRRGTHHVMLRGTVAEITHTGPNNHHNLLLLVEDPEALAPVWSESPQVIVHFRLHLEEPPFHVGDQIIVSGSLNELYSSVMIPYILAEEINGSDEF